MLSMFTLSRPAVLSWTAVLGIFISCAGVALAWTGPTGEAPNSNVSAPLNVSATAQIKSGSLGMSALAVYGNGYVQGNLGVGIVTATQKLEVVGNVSANGFLYRSDETLKSDIATIEDAVDLTSRLRGVTFNWKEDGRADIGVIAQEVEKVFPEAVYTNPITGIKSVEYGNLVAPLIEAIKEQQAEITVLKERIEALESHN